MLLRKKDFTENSLWVPLLCECIGPRESIPGNPYSQKSQKFKVWDSEPEGRKEQKLWHRTEPSLLGKLAPHPLACAPPLAHHTIFMGLLHRLYIENTSWKVLAYGIFVWVQCWRIRNRTSELIERVRFLIQKQWSCKYSTKHFPCGIVFVRYKDVHHWFCQPFILNLFEMPLHTAKLT